MRHRVYFDNASTTAPHPEVLKTYEDLLHTAYVNSESLYEEGTQIHDQMEKARTAIADLLGCRAKEVIFTGGASESNSMAVKGVALAAPRKNHIITSCIEHSSILHSCRQMERLFGYEVTYLPVTEQGVVCIEDVIKALRQDTVLVSIMLVNNEVGSINPIDQIKEIVKKRSHAFMHVDMTQAIGKIPCSLDQIDLASISAHKIEGLKGSGILIKREHVPMEPLISGGEQEFGLRGGTANAVANMVFAKTLRLALENEKKTGAYVKGLQEHMIAGLREMKEIVLNSPINSVGCLVNFSCTSIPGEVMQNALNRAGFMVSGRSTCESRSLNPSHVLKAMGFSDSRASSCIRVSLSRHNTMEEVDAFLNALQEIIERYGKV